MTVTARALNSIFAAWRIRAPREWNISGELCSGAAIDASVLDTNPAYNPLIKCDCSFENSTICRITNMYAFLCTPCVRRFLLLGIDFLSVLWVKRMIFNFMWEICFSMSSLNFFSSFWILLFSQQGVCQGSCRTYTSRALDFGVPHKSVWFYYHLMII